MPYYEVLCLASGKLGRAELADLLRKTCKAFMDNGASLTRISPLGATGHGPRELAYSIRQNQVTYKTGFYVNVCAFASPEALTEVNRQLKIDERVLRHLAIKKSFRDAVQPIPHIDQAPPIESSLDPNDPDYALRKFMSEYEREFPDGNLNRAKDGGESTADSLGGEPESSGSAVRSVLASLKASSQEMQKRQKPGLGWLSDLKDSSDTPRSS